MEQKPHLDAKERLKEILETAGYYNISFEVQQPTLMFELLGERTYTADVQAEKEGRIYIFEVDGAKNHSTRRNKNRDKTRDRALLGIGRRTIRIPTRWLVGKGRLSDSEILNEIDWQIQVISGLNPACSVLNC